MEAIVMAEQPDVLTLIAQLEAERTELDVTIAHLRRRLGMPPGNGEASQGGTLGQPAGSGGAGRESIAMGQIRPDEFFRLSNPEAIRRYLAIMKRPQSPRAIVDGLRAGGVLTNAKNFYANIWTELKRARARGEIVNTPSGWGLSEWYPNKPKGHEPSAQKKKKGKRKQKKSSGGKETVSSGSAIPAPGKSAWTAFAAERMAAGKTMKQAAAEWKQRKATN
jgi:hypothetical protein